MRLTYKQFHQQLLGARHIDRFRWQALNYECSIWDQFAFADDGCHWLDAPGRKVAYYAGLGQMVLAQKLPRVPLGIEADWSAQVRNLPGYTEPDVWVLH